MVRHVVMFEWVPEATDSQKQAVADGLAELPTLIPVVRGYRYGPDLGLNEANLDYVVVADFDSVDDYLAYRDHPAHQAFFTDRVAPILATRSAVQYEL